MAVDSVSVQFPLPAMKSCTCRFVPLAAMELTAATLLWSIAPLMLPVQLTLSGRFSVAMLLD